MRRAPPAAEHDWPSYLMVVAVVCLTAVPVSPARAQAPPVTKWQAAVDARWGPRPADRVPPEIFDTFRTTIDELFAAFRGIDVDWAALRDGYRPEVAVGVSRGRFAGIMSHLALALRDSHTVAFDRGVSPAPIVLPRRGDPIFVMRGNLRPSTFDACATAPDDGTGLIYDVAPGHPLGVERGDRILDYDGRLWPELYRELLAAQLPLVGSWGSSPSSFEHSLVQSANGNWHLFKHRRDPQVRHRDGRISLDRAAKQSTAGA